MSKVDGIIRQIPRQVRRIPRMIGEDTRFAIIISLMKKNEMSFSELHDELGIKTRREKIRTTSTSTG